MENQVSRREFLRGGAVAAAALGAPGLVGLAAGPALGAGGGRRAANERIGVGFIGVGKRTFELLPAFLEHPDLRVIAVCDVDTTRRVHGQGIVDKKYAESGGVGSPGGGCAAFVDHRELLAMAGLDAVVISTPDHWHAHQVLDAASARKDIYCEKPLTLTIHEATRMIESVRTHNRVFQTGSQQRSEYGGLFRRACEYIRAGRLGDVLTAHVGVGVSSRFCDLPEEDMEPGLEWDRWLGPAPERPYNAILSPRGVHGHYPKWREYREYSGGLLTDMGAHHFDIVQWALRADASGPLGVVPPAYEEAMHGARLLYKDGVEVIHGGPTGATFIGTKGMIAVDRDRISSIPESILKEPLTDEDERLPAPANHLQDWVDCIRSRERCICDVEVGARSVTACHLLNLAYWHHRPLQWDPGVWQFRGDEEANGWLDYQRRAGYELPEA